MNRIAQGCFSLASTLTAPVCNAHGYYRLFSAADQLGFSQTGQGLIGMKCVAWGAVAVLTSLPGIALRALGARLQEQPYIEEHSTKKRSWSAFVWNPALTSSAGHGLTNAGVAPAWLSYKGKTRIERVRDVILQQNADIVGLCEVFNTDDAHYLKKSLESQGYRHFYHSMGRRAVGASSSLFFASKFPVKSFEFVPFPVETLVGRTKNCSKGFYEAKLDIWGRQVTVIGTHGQHSEVSGFPTDEDRKARSAHMKMIAARAATLVFGDLNCSKEELNASAVGAAYTQGRLLFGPEKTTWRGDRACAALVQDPPSAPMDLDYVLLNKEEKRFTLNTDLVEVPYSDERLDPAWVSDHMGLRATLQEVLG
jgi:endonuclease/exonuclease/phosphatase family metal-dependent hydrolase